MVSTAASRAGPCVRICLTRSYILSQSEGGATPTSPFSALIVRAGWRALRFGAGCASGLLGGEESAESMSDADSDFISSLTSGFVDGDARLRFRAVRVLVARGMASSMSGGGGEDSGLRAKRAREERVVRVVRVEAAEEVLRARVVSWEMREVRMTY